MPNNPTPTPKGSCCEKCDAKGKRGSATWLSCMHPHCPCHTHRDKNGHATDAQGNLVFDPECHGCDSHTRTLPQKIEAKKKEFAWLYSKKDPITGIEMVDATQLAFIHTALTDIWNSAIEEAGKALPKKRNPVSSEGEDGINFALDQSRTAINNLKIK